MIYLNVQGFLIHKDKIKIMFIDKIRPCIAGFIETHVTQEVEDHELYISSYGCVRGDSESSSPGGVFLYIKEEIKYEVILAESCERN